MLVVESFLGFERPLGREAGHPEILVRTPMVERFGMPEIEYDNLARLLRDTEGGLGYEAHRMPVIALFHRLNNLDHPVRPGMLFEGISTHSFRWDNALYVNGDKRTDPFTPDDGIDPAYLMSQVILQAAAHSPKLATKLHKPGLAKTALLPSVGGPALGEMVGLLADFQALPLFAGTTLGVLSALSRHGKRKQGIFDATKLVVPPLLQGHKNDIVFPNQIQS